MENIGIIALYFLYPALIIYLCYKFKFFNKIGIVVFCYVGGITLGNVGILPDDVLKLQEEVSGIAVVIALPLLLFSMNIKKWFRLAGKTLLSMVFAILSILIVAIAGYYIVLGDTTDAWQLSGMAVGVYTGGTPNLAAIKSALGIDPSRFVIVHTYDTIISFFYILFCITIAQRIFNLYLPAFKKSSIVKNRENGSVEEEDIHSYQGIFRPKTVIMLFVMLLLSGAIVGISVYLGSFVSESSRTSVIILAITSLSIAASFVPQIRNVEKTFKFGMYIIYVFCFIVGSMAKFDLIVSIDYSIMIYIIAAIFLNMLIHSLFCKLFEIDTDTFVITSVSVICSPPFVPVVASGLKNNEVILSGLTTGIIGYTIGNYLGISVALFLKSLL